MGFNSKATSAFDGNGNITVSEDTKLHQLKIEVYDGDGDVTSSLYTIAILIRVPGATGYDYLDYFDHNNSVKTFNLKAAEFVFYITAPDGLPANHTYKIFWNELE